MKKIGILCFAILVFGATAANAQGAIDRLLNKVDKASDKADRAGNTADRANKTGSKLTGLLGKKKETAVKGDAKTTINVTGATLSSLKTINSSIEASKGVASTKMKFSASGSTIVVEHSGTTENLLKTLQKSSPATFAEKNIDGLEDGAISLRLK